LVRGVDQARGEKIKKQAIFILAIALLVLTQICRADPDYIRAAYWDVQYPTGWGSGEFLRDVLEYDGYEILDADQLKMWMDARISDGLPSVVVFCRDIAPDTVAESMSASCTLRQYLNAGGKIVWFADIPMYYQGHSNGTSTAWGSGGSMAILGFNAAGGIWDSDDEVIFTTDGTDWGLTETWRSRRPALDLGLRVLAQDSSGYQAAWVKHYVVGDTYRGFVRLFDIDGTPNYDDIRRVAEYPNAVEPMILDSQIESDDDNIAAFYYPWYRIPWIRTSLGRGIVSIGIEVNIIAIGSK